MACVRTQSSCLVTNYLAAMQKDLSHVCTHALFTYWYSRRLLLLLLLQLSLMSCLQTIKSALGPLPFFHDEDEAEKGKDDKGKGSTKGDIDAETPIPVQQASHRPAVLADGSYASQTAITDTITTSSLSSTAPNIRFCALVL